MTVFASDTFTRPDSPSLGNCETGQPWNFTDWGISNNMARRGAGSVNAWVAAGASGSYDCSVDAVLADYVAGTQLFGTLARFADDNNLILWERVLVPGVEDAVKLYVEVAGVFVQRAIWGGGPGSTGLDPNAALNLTVRIEGLEVRCYANGVERALYTLTPVEDLALGSSAGMRSEGNHNPLFDDFLVESLNENRSQQVAVRHSARAIRFPYLGAV